MVQAQPTNFKLIFDRIMLRLQFSHILWICLVFALLIRAMIRRWKHRRVFAFMASLQGPIGLPFIGSIYLLLGVNVDNVLRRIREIIRGYPKLMAFWVAEDPHIFTSDLEVIRAILSSSENIDKFSHYKHFQSECPGIISHQGEQWRTMRKMMNPSFSPSKFVTFEKNFEHHTRTLVQKLSEHANGEEFDMHLPIHLCTLDIFFDNMVGRRNVQSSNFESLSKNIIKILEMKMDRAFQPLLWPNFMYSLSGKQRVFKEMYDHDMDFAREMLQQQMKLRENKALTSSSRAKAANFADIMLDNYEDGVISEDVLLAEFVEMAVAASITGANTSAWVFKLLAMYPDVQERLYQEIVEHCDEEMVTSDDLSELVYLEMVIKETLRHYCVPFTGRKITHDLTVNEKLTIPAGIEVLILIDQLHHDPEYWEKPNEFYPEHFSADCESSRPRGAYIPFLSGPRMCPGYKYGMRSMKHIIANLVLHYKFSTNEKRPEDMTQLEYRMHLMPTPFNGFNVQISRRKLSGIVTAG